MVALKTAGCAGGVRGVGAGACIFGFSGDFTTMVEPPSDGSTLAGVAPGADAATGVTSARA